MSKDSNFFLKTYTVNILGFVNHKYFIFLFHIDEYFMQPFTDIKMAFRPYKSKQWSVSVAYSLMSAFGFASVCLYLTYLCFAFFFLNAGFSS